MRLDLTCVLAQIHGLELKSIFCCGVIVVANTQFSGPDKHVVRLLSVFWELSQEWVLADAI